MTWHRIDIQDGRIKWPPIAIWEERGWLRLSLDRPENGWGNGHLIVGDPSTDNHISCFRDRSTEVTFFVWTDEPD